MHDLDAAASAHDVRVVEGAGFDPRNRRNNMQLAVEQRPWALRELVDILLDQLPGDPMAWMEQPAVSLVFLKDRGVVAEVGLLGGAEWIRIPSEGDRRLARPSAVVHWLSERGVDIHREGE